jgi:hypothetical protein
MSEQKKKGEEQENARWLLFPRLFKPFLQIMRSRFVRSSLIVVRAQCRCLPVSEYTFCYCIDSRCCMYNYFFKKQQQNNIVTEFLLPRVTLHHSVTGVTDD